MMNKEGFDIKKILVILDGMDDEPRQDTHGLTPRDLAFMPALERMEKEGKVTLIKTIPHGNEPATDVAILKILGNDVPESFSGRAWLEALGEGIDVNDSDLCIRCNLIRTDNGIIVSHAAEGIEDSSIAIESFNSRFANGRFKFYKGRGYRNLLIIKNCNSNIRARPVHTLVGSEFESLYVDCDDDDIRNTLNDIISKAPEILAACRCGDANGIALWGSGRKPVMFPRKNEGVVVAGVSLVKGIGKWMGMEAPDVKGASGGIDTDLKAKMATAADALRDNRFVLLHIEAPDEASHMRSPEIKKDILETIDRDVLMPLLNLPFDMDVTVMSDHATSSITGAHLDIPVKVVECHIRNKSFHNPISDKI